jgi:hypothetical protein
VRVITICFFAMFCTFIKHDEILLYIFALFYFSYCNFSAAKNKSAHANFVSAVAWSRGFTFACKSQSHFLQSPFAG